VVELADDVAEACAATHLQRSGWGKPYLYLELRSTSRRCKDNPQMVNPCDVRKPSRPC